MSEPGQPNDGNLVPAERHDLAAVPSANPLVSRGIADLAKTAEYSRTTESSIGNKRPEHLPPESGPSTDDLKELQTRFKVMAARLKARRPGQKPITLPSPKETFPPS
jgi:hypothetical protein